MSSQAVSPSLNSAVADNVSSGLAFEAVSYHYPDSEHGIEEVSFHVPQGELLAVIGRSGSGKSTILRLTAGLLTGQQGVITIAGRDIGQTPVWQREVGMVFQQYALFPHLNVLDNVAYGLKMRGVGAAARCTQALAMLERVGLEAYARQRPVALSGGQQQRVALARALVIAPRVLLLDEPLGALDAGIRHQLRDEIRGLQRAVGATTLLVTHDQEEALSMADRIAVVDGGRILQVDTPHALYTRPSSAAVARFVGQASVLSGRVHVHGQVDVGFGFWFADTGRFPPGALVDVVVRPEHVLPDPRRQGINVVDGCCTNMRYLGAACRYDFIPEQGMQVLLCEASAASMPFDRLPNGVSDSRLPQSVSIAPEAIRVLPRAVAGRAVPSASMSTFAT
ncbi:ABC transporter ATP-binding protein [Robbsia andropogonis]|uniref:ABC transporter ATP-binding protein n=1 Tax=Robbsia andropogonis TaxID=28092 RepID=UPI0009E59713|nr:ABC transporter ATP-binding protein [Robbsia andropogonis]